MSNLDDFADFADLTYAQMTKSDTLRHLRHLIKDGVELDNRDSFKLWIRERRRRGTLDKTLNVYIKAYNRYLGFKGETRIKKYREPKDVIPRRADMEDYHKLMAVCKGPTEERMRLVIDLLFKTGIRLGELTGLTLDSIGKDTVMVIGKNQKAGAVYLPQSVRGSLSRYLRIRKDKVGTNRLLTSVFGEPLTYTGIRGDIYNLAKRAGVHFSPHMARRFYARFLYSQGFDLEMIRLALRHESLDTTKRYMQVDSKDQLEVFRTRNPDFFLSEVM